MALTAARAQRIHWLVLHDEERVRALPAISPLSKGASQLLVLPVPGLLVWDDLVMQVKQAARPGCLAGQALGNFAMQACCLSTSPLPPLPYTAAFEGANGGWCTWVGVNLGLQQTSSTCAISLSKLSTTSISSTRVAQTLRHFQSNHLLNSRSQAKNYVDGPALRFRLPILSGTILRLMVAVKWQACHFSASTPVKHQLPGKSILSVYKGWYGHPHLHPSSTREQQALGVVRCHMLPNRSSAAAEAAAPPDSRSSSSASAESQPLLQRLGIGGSTHADALSARVRSSATGSPASGAASTLSIDDPGEEQRPPRPQGDSGAWKYLVALCALSVVICYADRSNMSTAILPMAEQFGWEKAYQGIVLSSFFTGYALTQVLGGQLADKYGGKRVLAAGVLLWSLFTALTPEAAALGTAPLLAARVLLGVGEGIAFPAIHSMIARNVPPASQSTAVGVVTAASYAGTALAFGVSPYIISEFGWPWVFYSFAACALLWLPLWVPTAVSNAPLPRPPTRKDSTAVLPDTIDAEGVSLGGSSGTQYYSAASSNDPSSSGGSELGSASTGGLRALFSRRELWAICVAQYCQSWGMYGLLNWLPTFFKDFYKVEIADLAAYTLLPYIVQGGLGAASGVLADRLIASGWSIRSVRILLQTVGMIGPAGCLLLAVSPIVGPSPALASQIITVGLGFSALSLGGVSVNHLDVAPRHAGLVFGAGNTAATLAGVVSVPFTGYLLQTTESWPLVFGVTAAHYVLGAALWAAWCGDTAVPEDKL
eukprot:CAMPEP_0202374722 /NCGR_PEP_ID=MMETSP1127-20130417/5492_1 /ASSEMBLY_ACC=CAM_ASM_000462 /TAXON_ID=3047 /ORGANISM="Dunaliella tertiolecta, Strain CCMP1320" /LENGTH=767 /DNA_ID=CAMNT_0048971947 /DNA_START=858 /DNA_END=3162 /DNA_ORIENTATION=+